MKKDTTPDLLNEVVDYTKRNNKFVYATSPELTAEERAEYNEMKVELVRLRAEVERLKKIQIPIATIYPK